MDAWKLINKIEDILTSDYRLQETEVHIKVEKVRAYGSTLSYLDIIVTSVEYKDGILWIK